jgi:hypothetical protein
VHVLHNRLLAPGAKLANCCRNHVEAAPAAGYLEQINGPVEHGCGLLDIALTDMGDGQIPQDDRLGLVTTPEATCGALQDRPCVRVHLHMSFRVRLHMSFQQGRSLAVVMRAPSFGR